ncbi:sensor histidine kinase [Pyxidicoccus xibeiensis]|uniref:sensor histidine kinase n=1 Tax=Pyxidicoccus xibeiensis TaxID=2906759 RepID=UPI0020A7AF30|nr:histidine kinase [Pyxidicoccus xibeiensis]MCP3137599.1 histidine kinase [Pyxidicoccus xibeiensis]
MACWLLIASLGLLLPAQTPGPAVDADLVEVHAEDLPVERALDPGGEGWRTVDRSRISEGPGPFWLRLRVDVPPRAPDAPTPALALSLLGSWEAWWDGAPLGRNGRVGRTPAEELPGIVDVLLPLPPEHATPGPHLLVIRGSAHHRGFQPVGTLYQLRVGEASQLARGRLLWLVPSLAMLGALVLMGLHHLARYFMERRNRATLLLGLLCLAASAQLLLEAWRGLASYPYHLHIVRLWLLFASVLAAAVLLPATLHAAFREPRRAPWWGALAVGLLLLTGVAGFDGRNTVALGLSLVVSLVIALRARWRREPGAWAALGGLGFAMALYLASPMVFAERGFFIAFGGLLLCLGAAHAYQLRRQHQRLESATRASERLQLELLKRSIQPHFLMNTLGAVSEWVETEPAQAVRFIESLGAVYRHLLGVSGERDIPLARELELCRAYLEVMGYRHGLAFTLEAPNVDGEARIPPAVLQTLLENAFSHNRYTTPVAFRLQEGRAGGRRRYTFSAPAGAKATPGLGDGTGTRYLEARLDETFPGAWSLVAGPTEAGWTTVMEVPA